MKKTNKKKNKDNDTKKLFITIAIIILIIGIIGGSTFSYWRWESANSQKTNVAGTIPTRDQYDSSGNPIGFVFNIYGGGVATTKTMYPTNDCDGAGALVSEVTTVTAHNPSATDMTVYLALRATLTKSQGTLDSTNKAKLNWAIVDTSTSATCASPTARGNLSTVTTNTDIDTTISFTATKEATTTKTYRLYVWLDSSYEYTNYGSSVSDPMQNLTINVGWSPDSMMVQSPNYTFNP